MNGLANLYPLLLILNGNIKKCKTRIILTLVKTEGIIHRNWQHWSHKSQKTNNNKTKHNTWIYKDEQQQNIEHSYAQACTKNTIGHEPSYKQQVVETNRTWFLCGNCNEHHNAELRTYSHMIGTNELHESHYIEIVASIEIYIF